ncbi:MAG: DUF2125 domain-containing protein [Pseudomonadota bacterium]
MRRSAKIFGVVGASALILSVLWLAGSELSSRAIARAVDGLETDGWDVQYRGLETGGFPSRFDTRIDAPEIADPSAAFAWESSDIELRVHTFRPGVIEIEPGLSHTITWGGRDIEIRLTTATAAGHVAPLADFALRAVSVEIAELVATEAARVLFSLRSVTSQIRNLDGPVYDVVADIDAVTPPPDIRALLDPDGALPNVIEGLSLDASVTFDRPLDRFAIDGAYPRPLAITVRSFQANWGDLRIQVQGTLRTDPAGVIDGELVIAAQNWREIVDVAAVSGVLPDTMRGAVETSLALLAPLSGDPENVEAPLSFTEGRAFFGPFPLGPAPRIDLP